MLFKSGWREDAHNAICPQERKLPTTQVVGCLALHFRRIASGLTLRHVAYSVCRHHVSSVVVASPTTKVVGFPH